MPASAVRFTEGGIDVRYMYIVLLFGLVVTSRAADVTHLGVPPGDLVTLEMTSNVKGGCGEAKLDFVRLFPDGTSDLAVFRVPEGRALVVTDVDWHYFSGPPGLVIILSVRLENLADPEKRHRVLESPIRLGADGVGGASEHMTSGFLMSSQSRLCVDVINGPIGSPMRLSKVLLRGYLVDEP